MKTGGLREKTLALAGVFQSAYLVDQIATRGVLDEFDLTTMINSTLELNPASTDAVFGKVENLRTGLHCLIQQLGDQSRQRDVNIARYVIGLLHLQGKLLKRPAMLDTIATGVERAKRQSEMFGVTHANVLANLAGIYSETVSLIPPKIMVSGDNSYLSNPDNADKIRALLLAGMRCAVLWSQLSGSRWQILFKRKAIVQAAKQVIDTEISISLH